MQGSPPARSGYPHRQDSGMCALWRKGKQQDRGLKVAEMPAETVASPGRPSSSARTLA